MLQSFRKPLVVFTPKSLLRHPVCNSTVAELQTGTFHTCIVSGNDLSKVKKVLFCSGKIYYELEEERLRLERNDIVIVRIEQLYPLNNDVIQSIIDRCAPDCRLYWVQEEPENMGAWQYMERHFKNMSASVGYIGRQADACPATGSHHTHAEQQTEILRRTFLE